MPPKAHYETELPQRMGIEIPAAVSFAVTSYDLKRDGHRMKHMTFLGEEGMGGTPKDIAETVLFLASQEYITGQNFVVDGGRTLGPGWR